MNKKMLDAYVGPTEIEVFHSKLDAWVEKVVRAKASVGMVNTFAMIAEVDKIIADAFNHEPVISE